MLLTWMDRCKWRLIASVIRRREGMIEQPVPLLKNCQKWKQSLKGWGEGCKSEYYLGLYPLFEHIDRQKDSLINCATSYDGHAALKEETISLGHWYQARTVIAYEQPSATTSTSTRQQTVCLSDVSEEICQQQLSLSTHAHPVCPFLLPLLSKVGLSFQFEQKAFWTLPILRAHVHSTKSSSTTHSNTHR